MADATAAPAPAPVPSPKHHLPVGTWLSIAAFVMSLVGAGMVILGQFFAPKTIEGRLAVIETTQKFTDWKVEVVRVGQENASAQINTLNINVAKLLERYNVEPQPPPAMMAAPPAPPAADAPAAEVH